MMTKIQKNTTNEIISYFYYNTTLNVCQQLKYLFSFFYSLIGNTSV